MRKSRNISMSSKIPKIDYKTSNDMINQYESSMYVSYIDHDSNYLSNL